MPDYAVLFPLPFMTLRVGMSMHMSSMIDPRREMIKQIDPSNRAVLNKEGLSNGEK